MSLSNQSGTRMVQTYRSFPACIDLLETGGDVDVVKVKVVQVTAQVAEGPEGGRSQ